MRVIAVIPAYNAENSISDAINGLKNTFAPEDILVVDDGSIDRTAEISRRAGVRVIGHSKNRGKGAALKTGFHSAVESGYDAILTIDSDMQHPPELATAFIDEMNRSGADIVTGDRLSDISGMPLSRKFSNKTSSFFVRLWTGLNISDAQCGYRLIKSWVVEKADLRTDYYQTETELILEASRLGAILSSVRVPTIYNENDSKMNPFAETFRFIAIMIAHPFRHRRERNEN